MKHIVLAWELGGGNGHLDRLKALAARLLSYGYRVSFITCNLNRTLRCFSDLPVSCFQAPRLQTPARFLEQTPAYIHILHNSGYGDIESCNQFIPAWYALISCLKPDMLIADHAPTALLVTREMGICRINYGDGFTCPRPSAPLPFLSRSVTRVQIIEDEKQVLENCNEVLSCMGLQPLDYLGELYEVDETFLLTIPELDHLGKRHQVHYCGGLPAKRRGVNPVWPAHRGGFKLFVYLQQFDEAFYSTEPVGKSTCRSSYLYR